LTEEEINELETKIKAAEKGEVELKISDKNFSVKTEHLQCKRYQKVIHVDELVPSVIEPSFGIGRIMYAIWEHNFIVRDAQRTYFSLPPVMSPYKCSVLPLSNNDEFKPFIKNLTNLLRNLGITFKVDDSSGSIGRRYARTDEISIPFAITVDFDSLKEPHSVTLRERDSMQQVRLELNDLTSYIPQLATGVLTWKDITGKHSILASVKDE